MGLKAVIVEGYLRLDQNMGLMGATGYKGDLIWLLEQGSDTCSDFKESREPAGCRAGVQLQQNLPRYLPLKNKQYQVWIFTCIRSVDAWWQDKKVEINGTVSGENLPENVSEGACVLAAVKLVATVEARAEMSCEH